MLSPTTPKQYYACGLQQHALNFSVSASWNTFGHCKQMAFRMTVYWVKQVRKGPIAVCFHLHKIIRGVSRSTVKEGAHWLSRGDKGRAEAGGLQRSKKNPPPHTPPPAEGERDQSFDRDDHDCWPRQGADHWWIIIWFHNERWQELPHEAWLKEEVL